MENKSNIGIIEFNNECLNEDLYVMQTYNITISCINQVVEKSGRAFFSTIKNTAKK